MTYRRDDDDEDGLVMAAGRIDLRAVYELLRKLESKVLDLIARLDRLADRVDLLERGEVEAGTHGQHAAQTRQDHEARIRKLEAWRYAVPTTVIASIIAAMASLGSIIATAG